MFYRCESCLGTEWLIRTEGKKSGFLEGKEGGRGVTRKEVKGKRVEFVCESCKGVKDVGEAKMEANWHWESAMLISPPHLGKTTSELNSETLSSGEK